MGLLSGIGGFMGSRKESDGYRSARKILRELEPTIKKTQQMIDPWSNYRSDYASQLNDILTGKQSFTADPGYQFRVEEDQRAVERAASARGSNISGNVLTELASRRQDMASQEYSNVINRLIGLSAATPENAIAGGQFYGNAMINRALGMAETRIGQGFAQSRGISSLWTGLEDTVNSILGMTGSGSIAGGGGSGSGGGGTQAQSPGGMGSFSMGSSGTTMLGSFGGMGTNLTGYGANQGGIAGSNFGNVGGATSSVGSMW